MARWSRRLPRKIRVRDGAELSTLREAAEYVCEKFDAVTHSEPLAHACRLLMKAAETGAAADRRAAADQLEVVLRARRLI